MKTTIEMAREAKVTPDLVAADGQFFTRIEHLVALVRADERAAPVQEPVGYTDGDGRAWAVKWSGALPPNLTLFAIAINHLQEKTMAKHIDPRKGGPQLRESP